MADSAITFTLGEVSTYYAARVPHLKQRRARKWRGPCPIHDGQNDNFAVEPYTGWWFCHSQCGRGGDILELEAALHGGDFPTRKAAVFPPCGTYPTRIRAQRHRHEWTFGWHGTCKACKTHRPASGGRSRATRTWIGTEALSLRLSAI